MKHDVVSPVYAGYRFPIEIIAHVGGRYFRFTLGYREVGELLAKRGVIATYETIRRWSWKFGQGDAIRCAVVSINAVTRYLWRAFSAPSR